MPWVKIQRLICHFSSEESSLYVETKNQLDHWSGNLKQFQPIIWMLMQNYGERLKKYKNTISFSSGGARWRISAREENNLSKMCYHLIRCKTQLSKGWMKCGEGSTRSLIVSATGTGKTVLSAFDVQQIAKRLLFVVHRLNIAKKAMSEFKRVFGSSKSMGIYSRRQLKQDEFIFDRADDKL